MARPTLTVIVDHAIVSRMTVSTEISLGRLEDNSLVLTDTSVSGHHGLIDRGTEGWRYTDLGSSNGSLVAAGPRLGQDQHFVMKDVTQILLGSTVIEFDPGDDLTVPLTEPAPRGIDPAHKEPAGVRPDHARRQFPSPGGNPNGKARRATADSAPVPSPSATTVPEAGLPSASASLPALTSARRAGQPQQSVPRLLVVLGNDVVTVELCQPLNLLGRSSHCQVVIDDGSVSSQHAEISFRDGRWWVRDLGSTNGTRLGLNRLEHTQPLVPNSHIILGSADLLFVLDGPAPAAERDGERFLSWLRQRRKVTRSQARQALAEVRRSGRGMGEVLVSQGTLNPGSLTELSHNANLSPADEGRIPPIAWALGALLVTAAAALVALS